MADSNVIKEFLVAIGFKTDEPAMKKAVNGVKSVTRSVLTLGTAMEATALAVAVGVAKWASNLEQLYFASQRTSSSVNQLQAFGLAARNFGASVDEAQGSVEALAAFLRENPGGSNVVEGWLHRVGLSMRGAKGSEEQLAVIGKMFQMEREQGQWFLAHQQASMLGISDRTALAMSQEGFAEELARQEARAKGWQKVAEAAHRFMIQLEDLKMQFFQLLLGFEGPALRALGHFMAAFSRFLTHHGQQAIRDFVKAFDWIIEGLGKLLDWFDNHGDQIQHEIEKTFGEVKVVYDTIKPAMVWLYDEFVALNKATDGWALKVGVLLRALKALGAGGIVNGIAGLGGALLNGLAGIATLSAAGLEAGGLAAAFGALGAVFGVAVAGAIGAGIGTMIYSIIPEAAQRWIGDRIGHTVDFFKDLLDPKKQAAYNADPKNFYASHYPWETPPTVGGAPQVNVTTNVTVNGNADKDTVKHITNGVEESVRRARLDAAIKREFLATAG